MKKQFLAMAILWTVAILIVCWMPMTAIANENETEGWIFRIPYFDKVVHFGMFFGFAALWSLAMSHPGRVWKIIAASITLAFVTEVGQQLPIIGRQTDFDDGVCDVVGAIFGLLFVLVGTSVFSASRRPVSRSSVANSST